jgi:hypothetical protein
VGVFPDQTESLAKILDIAPKTLGEIGMPSLVVVDETGRPLVDQEFSVSPDEEFLAPEPLVAFLEQHRMQFDAAILLAAALERAQRENKRVFLKQSGAYSQPSRAMSKFLEDHGALFDAEYVLVSIDAARCDNGAAVMARYRPEVGMLPWVAILDATGAVLITSDSPAGPIGFPRDEAQIGYFMHMLASTVQRSLPEQLQPLRAALGKNVRRN